MSLPEKPINQITKTTEIADDSLLIVEKSEGTKVIKYSDLMEAIKTSLGVVDTLNITEKGYIPEGYLVAGALNDKQAQIRAAIGYNGKEIALTWAQIEAKAAAGDFTDINIGDYKDITLTTGEKVRMEVAGLDTYYGYQSNNNHRIHFISRDCLATQYEMNDTDTNTGGFPASKLITTLNGTIYNTLPAEIRNVIKTDKWLCSTKGAWEWQTNQKLWIPSEIEVWGYNTWSEVGYGNGCGVQFPIFTGSIRHICKGKGSEKEGQGINAPWWCSSAHTSSTTHFCSVSNLGHANYANAHAELGVPLCFTL